MGKIKRLNVIAGIHSDHCALRCKYAWLCCLTTLLELSYTKCLQIQASHDVCHILLSCNYFSYSVMSFKCFHMMTHEYPHPSIWPQVHNLSTDSSNTCTLRSCHKHMDNKLINKELNWKYLMWHHKVAMRKMILFGLHITF